MGGTDLHLIYAVFAVVAVGNILFMKYFMVPKMRASAQPHAEKTAVLLTLTSYASAGLLFLIAMLLTYL